MVEPLHPLLNVEGPSSEQGLEERLALFGLAVKEIGAGSQPDAEVATAVEAIVDDLCRDQLSLPQVAELISGPDDHQIIRAALKDVIGSLICGDYGMGAMDARARVGQAMAVSGAGVDVVMALAQAIGEGLRRHLPATRGDGEEILIRRLMFDTSVVLGAYIEQQNVELDISREEAEGYADSLEETVAEQAFQLAELSRKDVLTGLYNQRAFFEHMQRESSHAERHALPLCLMRIDINRFKKYNTVHGHIAGDTLLAKIGRDIAATVREGDLACRNSDDRFSVILPRTLAREAELLCARLIRRMRRDGPDDVTFSLGVGEMGPESFVGIDDFVSSVDNLLAIAVRRSRTASGDHIEVQGSGD